MITPCKPELERLEEFRRISHQPWLAQFKSSEWDLATLLAIGLAKRRSLARRLRSAQHSIVLSLPLTGPLTARPSALEEFSEKLTIAGELLGELNGEALLLRLPRRLLDLPDSGRSLLVQARKEIPARFGFWVDPGKIFSRMEIRGMEWVADPLWHPPTAWRSSQVHKLHGWHEARWIRYYGEKQLKDALRRSTQAQARFLLLGHSKREEEAQFLINRFPTKQA
jgi:hypothetical protein